MAILRIPEFFEDDVRRDPIGTARNVFSIAKGTINPFFARRKAVLDAFKAGRKNPFNDEVMGFSEDFKPERGTYYYMHIDLGTHHDSTGVSMAHVDGFKNVQRRIMASGEIKTTEIKYPTIYFDFIGSISAPTTQEEVMVSDVRDSIIRELRERGFYLKLVTFDRYGSVQILQDLRNLGITTTTLSLDRTTSKVVVDYSKDDNYRKETTEQQYMAAWNALRDAIYDKRINIPYHDEFLVQCKRAQEDRNKKGGRVESSLDHYSLDMLESIAGTVFHIMNNENPSLEGSVDEDPTYRKHQAREESYRRDLGLGGMEDYDKNIDDIYKESDDFMDIL